MKVILFYQWALICLCFIPSFVMAEVLIGRAVSVSDGDTFTVLSLDKHQTTLRLDSIDAPEKKQAFGQVSKKYLAGLVFNQQVTYQPLKIDKYGRTVASVYVGSNLVNLEMVKAGMAWAYRKYAKDPIFYEAEASAKAKRIGLWADANPTPPWEFRHPLIPAATPTRFLNIPSSETFSCSGRNAYCRSMKSCAEAIFYMKECGAAKLDRDGDGIPCEKLCK